MNLIRLIYINVIIFLSLLFIGCHKAENSDENTSQKSNVLKEYIKSPQDKAKKVKDQLESQQGKVAKQFADMDKDFNDQGDQENESEDQDNQ